MHGDTKASKYHDAYIRESKPVTRMLSMFTLQHLQIPSLYLEHTVVLATNEMVAKGW